MPKLVRRKPLLDRIKDYLNPGDFLLWASEELETVDWDSKQFATPLALGLHVIFLVAKANTENSSRVDDDVFGDGNLGSGWFNYCAVSIVYLLTSLSLLNAVYTFHRSRQYRLFENSIDSTPSTPSAHRVLVDTPPQSSPLQLLTTMLGDTSAEARAHPDPTRDVWEIAVWDPIPICLRLFCFFSPGHIMVYWLFLPTLTSDPRPSTTVFTTIVLELLMSAQLYLLQSNFSQQAKDSSLIHKEVMSEYDIKFVHPRLNPLVRDVGTQFSGPTYKQHGEVDTYTPAVILQRGYQTHPNPNYLKYVDRDNSSGITQKSLSPAPNGIYTPSAYNRAPSAVAHIMPLASIRQPQFRQSITGGVPTGTSTGDGGSLGVYSHANSPLKKTTSMYDMISPSEPPKNSLDMARREIQEQKDRSVSPAKRQSEFPRSGGSRRPFPEVDDARRTSDSSGFGFGVRSRPSGLNQSRGPSRF
ncbi:hypothetical protein BJ878DRAFT_224650 [Calycina marina]|uniref:Meiotically up-regulated gene 154 protein n=1 Tax=Calycina marina TaxID=1763456 RepID=A0A9P7YXJ9_9HELO|nr:hypothetical protein BJ878DRAFT_224650 [Calycina marina]